MSQHAPNASDDEIDLGQLFATLWQSKWLIAFCTFVMLVLGGIYAFTMTTPKYTATASVMIEGGPSKGNGLGSLVAGIEGGGMLAGFLDDDIGLETELTIISSQPLLLQLVETYELTNDPEFTRGFSEPGLVGKLLIQFGVEQKELTPQERLQLTTDAVTNALTVSAIDGTQVFTVTFTTEDPQKSAILANTLVDLYIQRSTDEKFARNEEYIKRLANRVSELEQDLQTKEAALTSFNTQTDLINLENFQLMNVKLKGMRDRLADTQASNKEMETRMAEMRDALEREDLAAIARLSGNATLNALLPRAQGGDGAATSQFRTQARQILQQMERNQARDTIQISTLESSIAQIERTIDEQSGDLSMFMQLEREAASSKVIYEFFLGRLKGTSGELGISPTSARVLAPALAPTGPSAPNKIMMLVVFMIFGFLIGAAWVFIKQYRRTGVLSSSELEQVTGLPVLGLFPKVPVHKRSGVLKYLVDKPNSSASEAVRDLRTSLLLSNVDTPPKVILITSSLSGEGKTTQALALARNMAGLGQKVLLIEGDIRNRIFGEYFTTRSPKGILSVLSGDSSLDTAIAHVETLGCDVLIGEQSSVNAADIFSSRKFHEMIAALRQRYDAIIIDTPPVLIVPDARVIAQHADAVLYVVKWDSTSPAQVQEGLRLFGAVNTRVTGLVLSQIQLDKNQRYGAIEKTGLHHSPYYQN